MPGTTYGDGKPTTRSRSAAHHVDRLWRDGDVLEAATAADRVLADGSDSRHLAAGVAAAAAAADGALLDACYRWRAIADQLENASGVWARGRAVLAAALAGELALARDELSRARASRPEPSPRGLTVLLDGVAVTCEAVADPSVRTAARLAALAATTVPSDPMSAERWDELAITVAGAAGAADVARAMLAAREDATPRRRLLGALLALRSGRLTEARGRLADPSQTPILRRNAVLAAAVSVGLARRAGAETLAATWPRVTAVMAGATVEPLLLDAWGELSVAAAQISPAEGEDLSRAMSDTVERVGGQPAWSGLDQWWRLQRATLGADVGIVVDATEQLTALADLAAGDSPLHALAGAARTMTAALTGRIDADDAILQADALAALGRGLDAGELLSAVAARAGDPTVARTLLARSRGLRTAAGIASVAPDGLTTREREVGALIVDGFTQREIGARLYISPKTVEQHVARLRQKLEATNRAQLVAALRHRWGSVT